MTLEEYNALLDQAVDDDGNANLEALTNIRSAMQEDLETLRTTAEELQKANEELGKMARERLADFRKLTNSGAKPPAADDNTEGEDELSPLASFMKEFDPYGKTDE